MRRRGLFFEILARDDPKDLLVRDTIARSLSTEAHVLLELGHSRRVKLVSAGRSRSGERTTQWQTAGLRPIGRGAMGVAREAWIAPPLFSALEARLGRRAEAIASLRKALPVAEELLQVAPRSVEARRRLITLCSTLASLEDDADPAQGILHSQRTCELLEQICARIPVSTSDRDSLAEQLWHLAKLEDRIDCRADAIDHLARAAAVLDELLDATPSSPMGQQRLGECLYWLATLEDRVDHEARRCALPPRCRALRNPPPHPAARCEFACNLSTCYHVIGRLRADAGHPGESLEPYRKAIALRESLSRDEPRSSRWHSDCAGSWRRLGEALQSVGQVDAAVKAFARSRLHEREVRTRASLGPTPRPRIRRPDSQGLQRRSG